MSKNGGSVLLFASIRIIQTFTCQNTHTHTHRELVYW